VSAARRVYGIGDSSVHRALDLIPNPACQPPSWAKTAESISLALGSLLFSSLLGFTTAFPGGRPNLGSSGSTIDVEILFRQLEPP
jgi:hypothetical protein